MFDVVKANINKPWLALKWKVDMKVQAETIVTWVWHAILILNVFLNSLVTPQDYLSELQKK